MYGKSYCDESEDSSLNEEDLREMNNNRNGCKFDAENAVDLTVYLEKINFKERCYEEMMKYQFPY